MRGFAIYTLSCLLLAGCASTPQRPSIAIDHMIIPAATEAGGPVAAYAGFNISGAADRLLGIDCSCAASVELHHVVRNGDQVSMTNAFPLALPTGRTEVKPPGIPLHFMLINTHRAFAVGDQVPMHLQFERAGKIEVIFEVVANSKDGWATWTQR